jgi:hypothetical protein
MKSYMLNSEDPELLLKKNGIVTPQEDELPKE